MNNKNLLNLTRIKDNSSHYLFCKKMQDALSPFLYVKKVEKKEIILMEGETCNNIYFIRKGAIKQYYSSDGIEFIQNFFFEGNMACDFNSFLTQTESSSSLEVLEGSELWVLSLYNYKKICVAYPDFKHELVLCMSKMNANRVNLMLISDAMLRYKKFLNDEPKILQRVPQYMVASYLGMTEATLSKIRKKLTNKLVAA